MEDLIAEAEGAKPGIYLLWCQRSSALPSFQQGGCFVALDCSAKPMSATPLVGNTFFGIDISQLGDQLLSIRRRISKRVLLLDFSQGALTLAEASLSQAGVQLNHVSRLELPEEALDRGTSRAG